MSDRKTVDEIGKEFETILPDHWLVDCRILSNTQKRWVSITAGFHRFMTDDEKRRLHEWCDGYRARFFEGQATNEHPYGVEISLTIDDEFLRAKTPLETAMEKIEKLFTPEEKAAIVGYGDRP